MKSNPMQNITLIVETATRGKGAGGSTCERG
jgi:hypothetical protein